MMKYRLTQIVGLIFIGAGFALFDPRFYYGAITAFLQIAVLPLVSQFLVRRSWSKLNDTIWRNLFALLPCAAFSVVACLLNSSFSISPGSGHYLFWPLDPMTRGILFLNFCLQILVSLIGAVVFHSAKSKAMWTENSE